MLDQHHETSWNKFDYLCFHVSNIMLKIRFFSQKVSDSNKDSSKGIANVYYAASRLQSNELTGGTAELAQHFRL